ncbi:TolC family protein [candidate division KSB1 bacterium]|nr:TolC family protein [candidate division KSB1 bacterium]
MNYRSLIRWTVMTILFAGISGLHAQDVKKLSMDDCVKIALENNSVLKNKKRDVDLAGTDVVSARSALLPSINASLASGKYIQGERKFAGDVPVGIDTLTGEAIYEQKTITQSRIERNSHYANISLTQQLWDWGRDWRALKQANLGRESARLSLLSTKNQVVYNVKEAYFELLKAKKLGEVYQEAVTVSEEQLKRTEVMYQIGSIALADVYKAKVQVGRDQVNLITQQNIIVKAEADLNYALGLEPNSPIDIEEMDVEVSQLSMQRTDAVQTAVERNPDLKNIGLNIDNYYHEKRKAQLAFLPTISGRVSYQRDNEDINRVYNKHLNQDYSVNIGAQLDLNIFKGFADKAELQRQSLNYAKAEEDYIDHERQLKSNVTQAYLNVKAYREIADINSTNLESAQEDFRLAQERYKIGSGTLIEVIDAQLSVTQAKSNLVTARYNTQIALAYLNSLLNTSNE